MIETVVKHLGNCSSIVILRKFLVQCFINFNVSMNYPKILSKENSGSESLGGPGFLYNGLLSNTCTAGSRITI